jgi:hypothetical protein
MTMEFSQQIFEKRSNITFNENPSSCSMRTDGQTDMMKLIFAFRNFAKAPKNASRDPSEHFKQAYEILRHSRNCSSGIVSD